MLQDAKDNLRLELKHWLNSIEEKSKSKWDQLLSDNLYRFVSSDNHKFSNTTSLVLGCYAPMTTEADWTKKFLGESNLCFPQVDTKNKNLIFRSSMISELRVQKLFGKELRVPDLKSEKLKPHMLLVPGLAFTEQGHRLGRGGGYYDRYLGSFKGTKLGICYEGQLRNKLPQESHDALVDYIVTEKRVIEVEKIGV